MVTYRIATEADYPAINDFHNRLYPSSRTLEQFYWEFHRGPFGPSVYVVALDDEKIIGTNCVIPMDLLRADQRIVRSGKSEDTLVDPAYRGQKIFYHIYEFLFEQCRAQGIAVIWGFTSAKKPFQKLGFSVPFDHQQSLAVHDVAASYRYLSSLNPANTAVDRLKILGLCAYSKAKLTIKITESALAPYEIKEGVAITAEVDDLLQATLSSLPASFAIAQDPAFQQWRIYDNPNFHRVHTYGFYDAQQLRALIVLNSHPDGVAYVCQSLFAPAVSNAAATAMIQHVTQRVFEVGIVLIRNWHFDTNPINVRDRRRYSAAQHVPLSRGIGLVWKELSKTGLDPRRFILSRIATQGAI